MVKGNPRIHSVNGPELALGTVIRENQRWSSATGVVYVHLESSVPIDMPTRIVVTLAVRPSIGSMCRSEGVYLATTAKPSARP